MWQQDSIYNLTTNCLFCSGCTFRDIQPCWFSAYYLPPFPSSPSHPSFSWLSFVSLALPFSLRAQANCYMVLALKSSCAGTCGRALLGGMGDGELHEHWPSHLVRPFTTTYRIQLFTGNPHPQGNYQLPSGGHAGAFGDLTLTAERGVNTIKLLFLCTCVSVGGLVQEISE